MHNYIYLLLWASLASVGADAMASHGVSKEQLQLEERRQARSVHLWYDTPGERHVAASTVSLDMTVRESVPGSYFCALAFTGGYIGLQELPDGKRIAIFSVWDEGDPFDAHAHEGNVPESDRTKVLRSGENVRVKRFSGEGTGAQSMVDFPWETGKTYTFTISAWKDGERHVAFSGSVKPAGADESEKLELAAFSTRSAGDKAQVAAVMSFVEDFLRNFQSARQIRRAEFTNVIADGKRLTAALFTGDRNPAETVDAGLVPNGFFLQTGGDTKNTHAPLGSRIKSPDL